MSTSIPQPLRAAAGLAAVAIDSARKLPSQVVGFPVLAVSAALQASLKAQQRYAELVARGDQLLGHLRPPEDGAPPWARFDDEPVVGGAAVDVARPASAFDAVPDPLEELLDEEAAEVLGTGEPDVASLADAESGFDTSLTGGPEADATPADLALADLASDLVPDPHRPGGSGPDPAVSAGLTGPPGGAGTEPGDRGLAELVPDPDTPGLPGATAPDAAGSGAAGLDADAELADRERAEGGDATADWPAGAGAGTAGVDPTAYDGYLAAEPPIPRYDELSIPQLRGRLRMLDEAKLEQLVAYERANAARAPYLTMLENRLTTLRSR